MSLRTVYTAMSGMLAQQARLDAASSNVANVDTPGYARRRVLLAPVKGQKDLSGVAAGGGVLATSVDRMLDPMLQAQVHFQAGRAGSASTYLQGCQLVETAVARGSGSGFLDSLNDFFDALGDVSTDPGAPNPRQLAITSAQTLCDQVQHCRADLQQALEGTDDAFVSDVTRANQLIEQIAGLNVEIAGSAGTSASLEDLRDQALRELSDLTGAVGLARADGTTDVLMGGHYLVQLGQARELEIVADPANPGLHTVSFRGQTPPEDLGGAIVGRLVARDEGILQAMDDLDSFVTSFADAVNAVHSAGYGLDGTTTGLNLFEYDPLAPAGSLSVNAALVADPDLLAAAAVGSAPGDGTNATALEALRTNPPAGSTTTLIEDYGGWLAAIGGETNSAQMRLDTDADVLSALDARQAAMSGVSLDEEALAVQEAQRAYVAAQRAIEAAMVMLDSVLTMGT